MPFCLLVFLHLVDRAISMFILWLMLLCVDIQTHHTSGTFGQSPTHRVKESSSLCLWNMMFSKLRSVKQYMSEWNSHISDTADHLDVFYVHSALICGVWYLSHMLSVCHNGSLQDQAICTSSLWSVDPRWKLSGQYQSVLFTDIIPQWVIWHHNRKDIAIITIIITSDIRSHIPKPWYGKRPSTYIQHCQWQCVLPWQWDQTYQLFCQTVQLLC